MLRRVLPMAAGLAAVALAAPAFAEGSFESYFSAVHTGFDTRSWNDNHNDSNSTTFAGKNCSYTGIPTYERRPSSFAMELNRNDTWTPDEHYGEKTVPCSGTTQYSVSWGEKGAGNFDMTLKKISGASSGYPSTLNVAYVKIAY